ncbi:MAG: serine hydrolase [Verrucomicrobiota bacterium]
MSIFLRWCLAWSLGWSASVTTAQESYVVMEHHSGKIFYESHAEKKRPVASLTKVATAMVVLDWAAATRVDLGLKIPVQPIVLQVAAVNPLGLRPGDRISLRDLLYSALLGSDNVAANALAHYVGTAIQRARGRGGDPIGTFVDEMNNLAEVLGMSDTRFGNPHGLDDRGKGRSTAIDLAKLTVYGLKQPAFGFMVKQRERTISVERGGELSQFRVESTNQLLGQQEIDGVKTGLTRAAGQCLIVSAPRETQALEMPDGRKLLIPGRMHVIVLGSPDRFRQSAALLAQGWAAFDAWQRAGRLTPPRELLKNR